MSIRLSDTQRNHSFRTGPHQTSTSLSRQHSRVAYLVNVPDCVRDALFEFAQMIGLQLSCFNSLDEYLQHSREEQAGCLILDLQSHDREELDSQCRLAREACPPVIFVCRHCDVSAAVCAIKSGAVEVFALPVDPNDLRTVVEATLDRDQKLRQRSAEHAELQTRYSRLTPREREVLPLVVGGLLNKQAAGVLGISEVTLQIHRTQVMRKMQADSVAHLVRLAARLNLPFWAGDKPDASSVKAAAVRQQLDSRRPPQRIAR